MDFQAFVRDIRENEWPVFGVQVYEKGRLAHQWGDTQGRHPVYSVTKTMVMLAAGMAADEGKVDIQRPVLDCLPSRAAEEMGEEQRTAYAQLPLRRLMCMSVVGYPFRLVGERNWLQEALQYPIRRETGFHYSNVSAYLTAVALTEALQEDVFAYLQRKVFAPLGIVDPPCQRCPDGYFYGASGMELSVDELSRVGMLLYQDGVYGGKRLISAGFLQQAMSLRQPCREGGYGYFLWQYRDGVSINGKWGQKCCILPKEEKVITYLSDWREDTMPLKQRMEKHLL